MLMQSRHAAMGEMISMIAHQWRQPLATIGTSAINIDMQLNLNNEISKEDLQKHIETVEIQTQYLSKTINDFMGFLKPQNKSTETIEALNIIYRATEIISSNLKSHNIELNIDHTNRVKVLTYSNELMQVLLSIIHNAKDALVKNKTSNPKIDIYITDTHNTVTIDICDNTGGIDDEISDKLAEPYFTTKQENGTGLGLYIAKVILEKHLMGSIEWKNIDDGACFTIKLSK